MSAATFMDLALEQAENAKKAGEVPIGCVIVRDGAVIARAGNRTLTDRDPTAHAEVLALREAARTLGSERLTGCISARSTPRAARWSRASTSSPRPPATTRRKSIPPSAKPARRRCCGSFSRQGGKGSVLRVAQ